MSNSATPWIAASQVSLSITNSQSPPKSMSIESVVPSSHLILCRPLLLLPPIPPSIRVFSNETALHIRWPKYWSFSFNISPSKEYSGLISFRITCCTHTYIQSLSNSFLIWLIKEYWVAFPVLYCRYLLVIYFIYSSVCLLIPSSLFNPSPDNVSPLVTIYSQQKQDWDLTVAQIMNSLLPNSDWNWRK